MLPQLSPGEKAARTRRLSQIAAEAVRRRRINQAFAKARQAEKASKAALSKYCTTHGWKVAFFEGKTGAPRTGIIDAIAYRLDRKNADGLEVRLIQLKGGNAGISGREMARLKNAAKCANVTPMIAAFDGEVLHVLPEEFEVRISYK